MYCKNTVSYCSGTCGEGKVLKITIDKERPSHICGMTCDC